MEKLLSELELSYDETDVDKSLGVNKYSLSRNSDLETYQKLFTKFEELYIIS